MESIFYVYINRNAFRSADKLAYSNESVSHAAFVDK